MYINYHLYSEMAGACSAGWCCSCPLGGACDAKTELNAAFQGDVWCASPPQLQWRGACAEVDHKGAPNGGFSLPPLFSPRKLCYPLQKKKKKRRFGYLSFNFLLSYFFFNFIPSQLIFVSNIILILLIIVYLVLNYLPSFFFSFNFIPLYLVSILD